MTIGLNKTKVTVFILSIRIEIAIFNDTDSVKSAMQLSRISCNISVKKCLSVAVKHNKLLPFLPEIRANKRKTVASLSTQS